MSDLFNIVLTASLTCCGGIFLLAAGEIIIKFFIEPIHDQFRLIGEIADSLIFYAREISSPGTGRMDEASQVLRQKASLLSARTSAIRWYWLWQFLKVVLTREDIKKAHQNLIGLSNSIHQGDPIANYERTRELAKLLRIDILD